MNDIEAWHEALTHSFILTEDVYPYLTNEWEQMMVEGPHTFLKDYNEYLATVIMLELLFHGETL